MRAQKEILNATDESNVKVKGQIGKYLGDVVEQGLVVTTGVLLGPPGALAGKAGGKIVGKTSGKITDAITKKYKQSKGHKSAKKLQHLFEGFDAKDRKWIEIFT